MSVLLNPSNHGKWGIRWLFVLHTVVMFLLVTAFTAMYLGLKSIAYIDMRAFPGNDSLPPGYTGYQHLVFSKAISLIPRILFMLNNWLADGLLVSFVLNSVTWVSNANHSSSSIVASLSMP